MAMDARHPAPGKCLVWAVSVLALIGGQVPISANPADPQVIRGSAKFDSSTAGLLKVLQDSDKAIIDWRTFSIAAGETTQFIQPSDLSAALNRVTGGQVSMLEGALKANGRIFLLNPNGVIVGRSGSIDVGSFVASSLDIDDDNFWNGGDLHFQGKSEAPVINLGEIGASGGDVFLIGSSVRNEGRIRAPKGTVGLAAGNDVLIASSGEERVFVRGAAGGKKAVGVDNKGVIEANVAELKAHGGNHYALAIRNEGRIAATGITRQGGQVLLRANGGKIQSSGVLRARRIGGEGGTIKIEAGPGPDSRVDLSGSADAAAEIGDGGDIAITATDISVASGATITAAAGPIGNGGQALLIAENRLDFHGVVSARGGELGGNGGFVDLSGKRELFVDHLTQQVDLSAPGGKAGLLLLDPIDIQILAGTGGGGVAGTTIYADDISSFLNTASVTITTTAGAGNGDISMLTGSAINWNSANSLSFVADRDFQMISGTTINASGLGSFSVTAARSISLEALASITTSNGNLSLSANQQVLPTSGNFIGIDLNNAVVQTTGTGSLTIAGRGGDDAAGFQAGVQVRNGGDIIGGTSGPASITGTGGNSSGGGNRGVNVNGTGSTIQSIGGTLLVEGVGGGSGTSSSNSGVAISSGGIISNTGTGVGATVTVRGTGGNLLGNSGASGANHGVDVNQGGSTITSAGGAVLVEGTAGGNLGSSYNAGVFVNGAAAITSTGTGSGATVTVAGTGGNPGGIGTFNVGVWVNGTNGRVSSSGGAIAVNGIGSSLSEAVLLENTGAIASGGNANVTVTADSLNLTSGTINSGTGTTTILNRTVGTLIDLGAADILSGGPLTLGLTDAELDGISAGLLQIGNSSSVSIAVSNAISHGNHLSLTSGAGSTVNQAITMALDKNLTLTAVGTIHLSASSADLSTAGTGAISMTTARNILLGSGSSVVTADGNLSLSANHQLIATSGTFAGIEVNGGRVETTGSGDLSLYGRGGNTGDDNIGLKVTGGGQVIGGTSGISLITGLGGISTGSGNIGVEITGAGSMISSNGDNVVLAGEGGGTGATSGSNSGVFVSTGGTITSGLGSGVSVTGTGGGSGEGDNNKGVWITQTGTAGMITSGGGYVDVVGTGGGTGTSTNNQGVDLAGASTILSTGGGALTVTGTGGADTLTQAIRFSGTVSTAGNQAITLITDSFHSSGGTINSGTGTTTIRTLSNGHSINLGGADVAGSTLGLTDAELDRITAGTLQIGNGSSGAITVSSPITHGNSLSLTNGAGITNLAANLATTGKGITFNGDVILHTDILIDSTNGGTAGDGANVSITGGIEGSGSAQKLAINAGTLGSINLQDAVGEDDFIGDVDLTSGGLTLGNTLNSQGNISFLTDSLSLAETVSGTGTLLIAPRSPSGSIGIGGAVGTLQLDPSLLDEGFTSISIGNSNTGTISLHASSFADPVTFTGSRFNVFGQVSGTGNASLTFDGNTGETTYLGANLVTEGQAITIDDSVILLSDVLLDTTTNNNPGGANVMVTMGIEGDSSPRNFQINAGTGGAIELQDAVGAGGFIIDIDFASSQLTLADALTAQGNISLLTDTISLNGAVTGNTLLIAPQTTSRAIGIGGATGGLEIDTIELGHLSDGFSSIQIGNSSTGVITMNAATFQDPVTFTGSDIEVNGLLAGDDDASLTFAGPASLGANLRTNGNGVNFNEEITLLANVLVDTTQNGGAPAGSNIAITGTVNADLASNLRNFTLNAGSSGTIDIDGAIGNSQAIQDIDFRSGALLLGGSLTAQGNISLLTDAIALNGNVTGNIGGTSTLAITPRSTATSIGIGGAAGTLNLLASEIAYLQNGFSSITIGSNAGTGAINVDAITFNDPITLLSPGGPITVNGQITGAGNASVTVTGNGPGSNSTTLNAPIVTSGNAVSIQDNVILAAADTTIATSGGDVTITGAVNADSAANLRDFSIHAGGGTIDVSGAIGGTASLNNIDFRSGALILGGSLTAQGNISLLTDAIALNGNVTGNIGGTSTLAITPRSTATSIGIGGAAGTLNLLASEIAYLQNGFSSITIGSNAGTGAINVDAITFNDPITLLSPGGPITVNGQITGAGNASVTLTGNGPGSNSTTLNAPIVTSGNAVSIQDNVILGAADTRIDTTGATPGGANITITGTVDADAAVNLRDFNLNAGTGGTIQIGGAVGSANAVQDIDFKSSSLNLTGSARAQGEIDFLTDTVNLGGNLTSPGALQISPQTATGTIGIGNGATGTLQIDTTELGRLTNGFSSLSFGSSSTRAITVNEATFLDPVTFTGSPIHVNGLISGHDNATVTFAGATTTNLDADVITQGNAITFHNSVRLLRSVWIDTTQRAAFPAGADITASSSIDGIGAPQDLRMMAGGTGNILLQSDVGLGDQIQTIDMIGGSFTASAQIRSQGSFYGHLANGFTLTGSGADLITADRRVEIDADSNLDGVGTFTIGDSGGSILTGNADFSLTAADVVLAGIINAGTGEVSVRHSRPDGTISLGPVGLFEDLTIDTVSDLLDGSTTSLAALLGNKGGDGRISLREAILATNNTPGRQTAIFAPSLDGLRIAITRAGADEDVGRTGDFDILGDLILSGRGTSNTIIDGGDLDRVFDVRNGALVFFENLTIRNGSVASGGGGGLRVVNSSAQLTNTVVTGNLANNTDGGGIHVTGDLVLRNSTVSANQASRTASTGGDGGGIYHSGGNLEIIGSTISGNLFGRSGGALRLGSGSTTTIKHSTLSGNTGSGGSPTASGALQSTNGNTIALIQSTVMGNYGGLSLAPGTTTSLRNSIIAGNTGTDVIGAVTASTNTLIGNAAGGHGVADTASGNIVGNGGFGVRDINTILDTNLANNGGPTLTHALVTGSPAINAGNGLEASNARLFTDQRGAPRISGGAPDMGAVEYGVGPLPTGPGFSLDNLELNRISAGHLKIGALSAGTIRVTEAIAVTPDLTLLAAEQIAIEGDTGTTADLLIESPGGVTSDGTRTLRGNSVTVDADIDSRGDLTVLTQGTLDLKKKTAVGTGTLAVTAGRTVDLRRVTGSGIEVTGRATNDTVLLSYVPSRLRVNTGAGIDTVTFASAAGAVSTNATSYSNVETLVGSAAATDSLIGSSGNDTFTVTANNQGTIRYVNATPPVNPSMAFQSFESLRGGAGNDRFNFTNQATVSVGVNGDAQTGVDTLFIDDSNLTTDQVYTITANSVQRNPVYPFSGIEALVLNTGSGEDQVNTGFMPFTQTIDGGPGEDTLTIPEAVNTNTPITQVGSGNVSYADVEKVVGRNGVTDTGGLLQNKAGNALTLAQNNAVNGNPDVIDNFNGGANLAGGLGGAAGVGAAGVAGLVAQSISSLPNAGTSPLADFSVTPYNSGGSTGAISLAGGVITIQGQTEINQNIAVNAEMELNDAMGNGAMGTADGNDGAIGIAGETGAAPATEETLGQGTAMMAEGELLGALGENVIVVPGDGTVPMGDLGAQPGPGAQQEMGNQGGPLSFSDLSQAIGGDGTAPTGPGAGIVDLILSGNGPGAAGAANLGENLNALTETELEGALNGL